MNIQKANTITFWQKYDFLKITSLDKSFKQVSCGFELRICCSQDQCLRPLSYDDIHPSQLI